jgi:peptidoglycan/LPS O-acetylase OafA/YrhL
MKSRYSILLGIGIVIALFFLVTRPNSNNGIDLTYIFTGILLVGGYITTYTSNIKKSRVALIAGLGVSILLIVYQLFIDKLYGSGSLNIVAFLIIPGFVMIIGGFIAKITKNEFKHLLEDLNITNS